MAFCHGSQSEPLSATSGRLPDAETFRRLDDLDSTLEARDDFDGLLERCAALRDRRTAGDSDVVGCSSSFSNNSPDDELGRV